MEFVVGIIVGAILYYVFGERKKVSGTFTIDLTEDAKEPIQLKMDEGLNSIYEKKYITLKVRVLEDDSRA